MRTAQLVYLVMGHNDHEPSYPVRVFTRRVEAEVFVARWSAHQAKRPPCPRTTSDTIANYTEEDHKVTDKWLLDVEAWRKRSPGGKDHADHNEGLHIYPMGVHK